MLEARCGIGMHTHVAAQLARWRLHTLRVCQPTAANAATVSGGKLTLAYVMSTMSGRAAAMKAALVLWKE